MPTFPSPFESVRICRACQHLLPALIAAAVLIPAGGCDTTTPRSSEDEEPSVDATSVQLSDDSFERADLQYDPVSLAPGETFTVELTDAQHDRPVARTTHVGTADGGQTLRATFAPLEPSSVTVRCRNEITGTTQTITELPGDAFGPSDSPQPMAKTQSDPDSYHYIEDEGGTVVVYDYDDEESQAKSTAGPTFNFPSADEPVQCTHVSFTLAGVTGLSPTGVRFSGDVSAPTIRHRTIK